MFGKSFEAHGQKLVQGIGTMPTGRKSTSFTTKGAIAPSLEEQPAQPQGWPGWMKTP